MNVQLYVYDLSNGLARMLSEGLLGTQIDAVYHTSIVIRDIEYVYDGGIKTVPAGKTHLEAPWQIIELGTTDLPMDVIMEYLDSLRDIYTAQVCTLHSFSSNHEEANARPGLRSMVS
jgi:hypothetical protein